AFRALCDHFRPDRVLVTDTPSLSAVGGSALTDPAIRIPRGTSTGRGSR
ncbi:hypothetical protein B1A_18291, partial [mine drainage metagenome]